MAFEKLSDHIREKILAQAAQKEAEQVAAKVQAQVKAADAAAQKAVKEESEAKAKAQAATRWVEALVEAVYVVAAADGAVSDAERGALSTGLASLVKRDAAAIGGAMNSAAERLGQEGRDARLRAIAQLVQGTEVREAVFVAASSVAWKDGGIGEKQGLAVRALGKAFGIAEKRYFELLAQGRS